MIALHMSTEGSYSECESSKRNLPKSFIDVLGCVKSRHSRVQLIKARMGPVLITAVSSR